MKLVYKETLVSVKIGDKVTTNGGDKVEVTFFRPPHKAASEGKVSVRHTKGGYESEYYVGVIDAEWIEREDRGYAPKVEYEVEHTDTFGGEANYSWVTRKRLSLPPKTSDRSLVLLAKRALGLWNVKCKRSDIGDTIRLDLVGCCQVVFITPIY